MRTVTAMLLLLACAGAAAGDGAAVPEGSYTDKQLPTDDTGPQGEGDADAGSERTFLPVTHPGREVPLRVAARALVPKGCWEMVVEPGLEDKRVSWGTGPRWPEVVRRMADYASLATHFNYQDCRVGIARSPGAAKRLAGFDVGRKVAASEAGAAGGDGSTGKASGAASAQSQQVTYLEPSQRLSEALDQWVRNRGWSGVAWEIDRDFRVDQRIPMKGGVISAVTQLFETYRRQGALTDAEPVFARGNYMVVVRPMNQAVDPQDHAE